MKKLTLVFFMFQLIMNSLPISADEETNETSEIKKDSATNESKEIMNTHGYAAYAVNEDLKAYHFNRRELTKNDVGIKISYCGVCHSDVHKVKGEWGEFSSPLVPGHEIVGIVSAVGDDVTKYKIGDRVGVGAILDSCQECIECDTDQEQFCNKRTFTYGGVDKESGGITQGGYSDYIVVKDDFVLKIPDNLDLKQAAPLLCAGITTYSPLYFNNIGITHTVGVIGVGGLGHIAIKIAKAFGAEVVAFTHSPNKESDAKRLGADKVVVTSADEDMTQHHNSFDLILDTVSANHDANQYIEFLKRDGTLVFLGIPEKQISLDVKKLIRKRRNVSGSVIGGINETQEMLDFCDHHGITADIELISADKINLAYKRMLQSDVKYRFVIDANTFNESM